MKSELILIGGGGHCKSCIDVIEHLESYKISGILDTREHIGKRVLGYPVIGTDEQIERLSGEGHFFLITIGQVKTPQFRQDLYNELMRCNARLATIVSPRAYVSKHAIVKEGTIIMHDALVNAGAYIGKNCIINSKALIEHDVIVGEHCHISTAAVVNGGAKVKNGSFFGSNAVCKERAVTSSKAFVKAGSLFFGENGDCQ